MEIGDLYIGFYYSLLQILLFTRISFKSIKAWSPSPHGDGEAEAWRHKGMESLGNRSTGVIL